MITLTPRHPVTVERPVSPPERRNEGPLHCERLTLLEERFPQWFSQWRRAASESLDTPLELHPELLRARGDRVSLVVSVPPHSHEFPTAAFEDKSIRLPSLPGLPKLPALEGVRWIGHAALSSKYQATPVSIPQILVGLARSRTEAILLEDIETHTLLYSHLRRQTEFQVVELAPNQPRWRLNLAETASDYWARFSSKTRYNFRRTQRLLSHDWEMVSDAAEVPRFLQLAEDVSRRSWQDRRIGRRLRDDQMTRESFQRLARLGAFRGYVLRQGTMPLAFAVGTQWKGRFELEEIGYDMQFADKSPGTVLLLHLIEDLHARNSPAVLDFGFGDGAYKRLFGNEQTESGSLLLVRKQGRAAIISAAHRMTHLCQKWVRNGANACGATRWVRRWYRNA